MSLLALQKQGKLKKKILYTVLKGISHTLEKLFTDILAFELHAPVQVALSSQEVPEPTRAWDPASRPYAAFGLQSQCSVQ